MHHVAVALEKGFPSYLQTVLSFCCKMKVAISILVRWGRGGHESLPAQTHRSLLPDSPVMTLSLAESTACPRGGESENWVVMGANCPEVRHKASGSFRGKRSIEMELLTLEKAAVYNVMRPEERELFPWVEEIYCSVFSTPETREERYTLAADSRPVLHFCSCGESRDDAFLWGGMGAELCTSDWAN